MKQAAAMLAAHRLDFSVDSDGKVVLKLTLNDSCNTVAWVQTQGTVTASPCIQCAQGFGPFKECIVLEKDRVQLIGTTCANCYFNGEGHMC